MRAETGAAGAATVGGAATGGTTGVAALLEGRRVILVEREPQYAAIARARCAAAEASIAPASQPDLFATG